MAKKKAKYKAPKVNEGEIKEFKEHLKMLNEKIKAISEKYKKWWDTEKRGWKEGFKGHGSSSPTSGDKG